MCIDEGFAHILPIEDDALIPDLLSRFANTTDLLTSSLANFGVTAIGLWHTLLVLHLEW